MGAHPLNLTLRFLLELVAFWAVGAYGWSRFGPYRWLAAMVLPLMLMALWGVFAVPEDPSRGGKPVIVVPGVMRLVLELFVFGAAAWAFYAVGKERSALFFAGATLVHYGLSFDRIRWLLER